MARWVPGFVALAALAAPGLAKDNRFVEVDGQRYRVQVERGEAWVYNKAALVRWSIAERDNRLEAARRVTGCEAGEYLMLGSKLAVKLHCHAATAPK